MSHGPLPLRLRLSLWLIRVACALAPWDRRKAMREQWEAELHYRFKYPPPTTNLLLWALGAFQHAWYLFRTEYTMDLIWQDLRYGFRALNRSRSLIGLAVLSLAIGIGANTSIFSAVDVFMLRPLPYPDSHRLNIVWVTNQDRNWSQTSFSVPDFADLRERARSMDVAGSRGGTFSLSGDFEAERFLDSFF